MYFASSLKNNELTTIKGDVTVVINFDFKFISISRNNELKNKFEFDKDYSIIDFANLLKIL